MEKLWKLRRTRSFLLLAVLLPILSAILFGYLQDRAGLFGGLGESLPMMMLSLFTSFLLPLFLAMAAAESFSGEASAGTMKLVLLRPVTRSKAFASKVLALAFYTTVLLGVLWMASAVSGWAESGGLPADLPGTMTAYIAAFLPMLATCLIAVLIAQCFSSIAAAIGAALLLYAAAKLLPFFVPAASGWSVFSYTNWHVLWTGSGTSVSNLLGSFVILLSYCIMAYTAGWLLFERKQW
jgi:ABC-2 type transport system permease protein